MNPHQQRAASFTGPSQGNTPRPGVQPLPRFSFSGPTGQQLSDFPELLGDGQYAYTVNGYDGLSASAPSDRPSYMQMSSPGGTALVPDWDSITAVTSARQQRHEQPYQPVKPVIKTEVPHAAQTTRSEGAWHYPASQTSTAFDSGYHEGNAPATRTRSRSIKSSNSAGVGKAGRHHSSRSRTRTTSTPLVCNTCNPPRIFSNHSEMEKDRLRHLKPFRCDEPDCKRPDGFATKNDLERHRKAVHHRDPELGDKHGYVCAECPSPAFDHEKKYWPRKDNFKAHITRRHPSVNVRDLIEKSKTLRVGTASYVSDSALGSQMDEDVLDSDPLADLKPSIQQFSNGRSDSTSQEGEYSLFASDFPADTLAGIGSGPSINSQHRQDSQRNPIYIPSASSYSQSFGGNYEGYMPSPYDTDKLSPLDTPVPNAFSFGSNGMDDLSPHSRVHGGFQRPARMPMQSPSQSRGPPQFRPSLGWQAPSRQYE